MSESAGSKLERAQHFPTEGKLLIDDLLEQSGLSTKEFHELPTDEKQEVMGKIRSILKEPEVQAILSSRNQGGLRVQDSQAIRDVVGLEKWNKLSEVVSYVKTLIGETSAEERSEMFSKHLAFGVDANEIKHTLTRIHDVMPARLDTDIKHQSSLFYRAVVEVASNALDASIKHRSPIGRFGVGFYQILNHIKDEKDRVIVRTKSADEPVGIRIEFRNKNGNIDFKIKEDSSIENHGTVVELDSKEFVAEKADEIIKEYFSHTQDAEIVINSELMKRWKPDGGASTPTNLPIIDVKIEDGKCVITDEGVGMSPRVIFEKLLVPKLSEKPPVYELKEKGKVAPKLYYEKDSKEGEHKSEIIIQVGGIVIERTEAKGTTIVNTLVVDLPPSTVLGEQRDQIEVNEDTVDAFKNAVDQAMRLPRPDCFEVINSLGAACRKFQNRSKLYEKDDNMFVYLQDRVRESFPDVNFLPNKQEFLELELDKDRVAFLDTEIYQSPINNVHGLNKVRQWSSQENVPMFEAKFKKGSTLGIVAAETFLIIDENARPEENPAVVNKAIELATGGGKGEILDPSFQEPVEKEREIKTFENLEDLVSEQWESFSFNSQGIALRQARVYEKRNPQLTKAFTRQVLSKLHTVGAAEAWDILHWYINGDSRDTETKLAEIDQLSTNIDIILGNSKLAEILQSNGVPILSMFDAYGADVPRHMRRGESYPGKSITIEGKRYTLSKTWFQDSNHTRYITEEGSFVDLNGPGDIVFRNSLITVHKDKVVNTQTGEVTTLDVPFETAWGKIEERTNRKSGVKEFDFIKSIEEQSDERGDIKDKEKNWEVTFNRAINPHDSLIIIDGKEFSSLGGLKEKANIGKEAELKDVLKTESGDPLFVFHNLQSNGNSYFVRDDYDYRHKSEIKGEQFSIVDSEGKVIWKFDSEQWSDKVAVHEKYSYSHSDRNRGDAATYELSESDKSHIENTRAFSAQCIPISYDRPVSDSDFVLRIVKYNYVNAARFRETVAFINAKGEVVYPADIKEVSPLTLDIRYTAEASCPCCGINDHFGKSRYSPFVKGEEGSFIKSLVKLPVEIIGEFKYNSEEEHWLVMARGHERRDEGNLYMAVFDKQGEYLSAEKIGQTPQLIHNEFDFRNQEKHLRHRLPDRLRDLDTRDKDKSYWNYENEIRRFITLGDRAQLNRRVAGAYGSTYEPVLQEADNITRKLLDINKGELTPEHAEILKNFLLKYPIPDKEKLERVAYRTLEYRHIEPDDLEFLLPVLYESDYIPPDFLAPEMIQLLRQVSYLDAERFTKLFEIIKGSVPDSADEKYTIANKIIKFYSEKFQGESLEDSEKLVSSLSQIKEYSNAVKCDGFTLIKYKIAVPPSEVPRSLRPFITFVQREEDELAYKNIETIKVPEDAPQTIKLSEIIQWKRLRETDARNFEGSVEKLGEAVRSVVEGKTREHIVREITHAVHFQALNSTDLYVRELIQNAVDIMQSTGMDKEKRHIEITASASDNKELVTSFQDPVGMDIRTILNYFLVPGESTKLDRDKDLIGFYGQGVYTLFKNFKEVNIKTGTGDGVVWYLTIKPNIEHDMVNDVSIDFRSSREDFKGTVISKTQVAENPYIEAAYVKDAVMTLTSALSDNRASIAYQGEKINSEYKILSEKTAGNLGKITVYKNPNNIVTQYGLYVKDIGPEYSSLIPGFMNQSLRKWGGIAIDLPKEVELTRSRQDIANKDKVQDVLNSEIQLGLVGAYFDSFKEKMESGEVRFPFDELPYDYFSEGELYDLPGGYIDDAEALMKGEQLMHLEEYVDSAGALKFMSLLPLFQVKDQPLSLDAIRRAFISKSKVFPFDQDDWRDHLPNKLVELMQKQRSERSQRERQREEAEKDAIQDTTLDSVFEQATGELKEWMVANKSDLELVDRMTKGFMDTVNESYKKSSKGLFHYSKTGEIAHARRGRDLSWNLDHMKGNSWRSAIKDIEKFKGEKGGQIDNLVGSLETLAHEYGHIIEGFGSWTHDSKHDELQARILIQFIIQNGPQRILQALKPVGA
ncbi:MAG: hypothetical protein EXS59_02185 [Candidatus Taylorbacteria bacterium]|nr:hypothetical protein [Candidatus Taylorbacteria bacterium]